jgi:hypothetical protein
MALPKIDVPIYETKLISTGKTVRFRPFLVKEQKLFLMASQSDDAKDVINAIRQVLANCILDSNVDINTLPTFDLEHLFMQLRARSVGEIVNLKYVCNNTVKDEKNEDKICGGLVQIDVNLLEVEPTINPQHLDKIELTENMGVVMKYPNFNIVNNLNIKTEVDMFNVIIDCIDYIYDKDNIYYAKDTSEEELEEFIDSLTREQFGQIQTFFESIPRLKKNVKFTCQKCAYEEELMLEGIQSFFG